MMLDANTVSKVIKITIQTLKNKNPQYENEPARSILIAFGELADTFDELTDRRRAEKSEVAATRSP